jgi:hypothetical protein
MARILIAEPDESLRRLYEAHLAHLGHEVVGPGADAASIDFAIVEPAARRELLEATRLRGERPELPIVFVSVAPPSPPTRALLPVAHLLKPFKLADLDKALAIGERGTDSTT